MKYSPAPFMGEMMATRDTLNNLIQQVGLNKAVKLLNAKGVGKATYQKMADGRVPVSKTVIGKAVHASKVAEQQSQLKQNKELAKRLGFEKVQKRTGQKIPKVNAPLKELQAFNRQFTNRPLSPPSRFRLTGVSQKDFSRIANKYRIDERTVRFTDRKIVAKDINGRQMELVYLSTPKTKRGEKVIERDWYWTSKENLDHYRAFKAGQEDATYQVWTYDGVELHEFATDAQPGRFLA